MRASSINNWISILVSIFSLQLAQAGTWTLPRGETLGALSTDLETESTGKVAFSPWIEHGFTDRTTLGSALRYAAGSGFEELQLYGRERLFESDGFVLSAQAMFLLNRPAGAGQEEARLMLAHGFSWGFSELQGALRFGPGGVESVHVDPTVGYRLGGKLMLIGQFFHNVSYSRTPGMANYRKEQLKLAFFTRVGRGIELETGAHLNLPTSTDGPNPGITLGVLMRN